MLGCFLVLFLCFSLLERQRQDGSRSSPFQLVPCVPLAATFGQQSDQGSQLCRTTEGGGLLVTEMAGDTSWASIVLSTISVLPLEGHEVMGQELWSCIFFQVLSSPGVHRPLSLEQTIVNIQSNLLYSRPWGTFDYCINELKHGLAVFRSLIDWL